MKIMNKYRYILFDLDGTLTDSSEGITKSVVFSLEQMGMTPEGPENYKTFIGPPLDDSYRNLGFGEDQVPECIRQFRKRYETVGWAENSPYEGMIPLLEALQDHAVLAVATSKPTAYAEKILEQKNMTRYFDVIVGSNMDRTRMAKSEVIEEVLRQLGNPDPGEALMIGDREHDLAGAAYHNMDAIRVLYGFGTEKEHEAYKYLKICDDVKHLKNTLLPST